MEGEFRCIFEGCKFSKHIDGWPEFPDGSPQSSSVYVKTAPEGAVPNWLQEIRKHHRGETLKTSEYDDVSGHGIGEINFGKFGTKSVRYGRYHIYLENWEPVNPNEQ